MKEKLTYEEALSLLQSNLQHYVKSPKFPSLLTSLAKEDELINIFSSLKSINDQEALIKFIRAAQPKYLEKRVDDHGVTYIYLDKYIWTPDEKTLQTYGAIEEVCKHFFKTLPTDFYTSSSHKIPFVSFTLALNRLNQSKKTKISFVIPRDESTESIL